MTSSSRAEKASAVAAIAAAVAAAISTWAAVKADQRSEVQEDRQFANKVYVGEAPRYAYTEKGAPKVGRIWWVVMNPTGVQIDRLWVEGRDGRSINIRGVQRCTMYALAPGFTPVAVHFSDAYGKWRRQLESQLDHEYKEMPEQDTDDSPWDMDVQDCAG